jgi:diguanylate cyclase (GGDEF)-like protein
MNRRQFMNLAEEQIETIKTQNINAYFIIFDIDNFKKVNDAHGHLIGDKVLVCVAERVQKVLRPYDLFGRFGGEEFTILVSDISKSDIKHYTERIRTAMDSDPMAFDEIKITISASFGVAPVSKDNLDTIIHIADEALYKAKNAGRNRVVIAT